jgi:hypothetical protein
VFDSFFPSKKRNDEKRLVGAQSRKKQKRFYINHHDLIPISPVGNTQKDTF